MSLNSEYIELIEKIYTTGIRGNGRNGLFKSVFGHSFKINFQLDGFKLIKVRHLNLPLIVSELKWFLSGNTEIPDNLKTIWLPFTEPAIKNQIYSYGYAIRTDGTDTDQWLHAIHDLSIDNDNRQIVINLWKDWYNPKPCHVSICLSRRCGSLHMSVTQRSADVLLGLPWDITQYSILLFLIAKVLKLEPGILTWFIHDAHMYDNHIEASFLMREAFYNNDYSDKQEIEFSKFQKSKGELIHNPENFEVSFPNYKPGPKVKVLYNI